MRSLYSSISEGVCLHRLIYDEAGAARDYRILDVNPAYEAILGLHRDKAVGAIASEFYGAGEPPYLDVYAQVAESGQPTSFETYFAPMDRHFAISVFRPGPAQFATVFSDITERKRAESEREELIGRLEAQNAELERFTYTVSHDLKSPLVTIKGYVGLLKEDLVEGGTEAIEHDMMRIAGAADTMGQLLDELLELSRVGRLCNPATRVPLDDLARESLELVGGRIAARKVEVVVGPDLPLVLGDRPRLLQVLVNLIDNAVKYIGDPPRPRIEIGVRLGESGPVCYVRDNGMGIEPRYHQRVFGLFDQLDQAVEGSGVGLALVKRIIEAHGGRVWVESEGSGQGSTFCFTVPSRPRPTAATANRETD
ncbi:MAG: PAS domain-containing protein [Pirellulales bacterium]|nr:PAS domain-containing protein [Pirellulales bacterium]